MGIILIDIIRGYSAISGCNELASPTNSSSDQIDEVVTKYGDDFIKIIDRILEFDQMALNSSIFNF